MISASARFALIRGSIRTCLVTKTSMKKVYAVTDLEPHEWNLICEAICSVINQYRRTVQSYWTLILHQKFMIYVPSFFSFCRGTTNGFVHSVIHAPVLCIFRFTCNWCVDHSKLIGIIKRNYGSKKS